MQFGTKTFPFHLSISIPVSLFHLQIVGMGKSLVWITFPAFKLQSWPPQTSISRSINLLRNSILVTGVILLILVRALWGLWVGGGGHFVELGVDWVTFKARQWLLGVWPSLSFVHYAAPSSPAEQWGWMSIQNKIFRLKKKKSLLVQNCMHVISWSMPPF